MSSLPSSSGSRLVAAKLEHSALHGGAEAMRAIELSSPHELTSDGLGERVGL
jgi:hypothetical protein